MRSILAISAFLSLLTGCGEPASPPPEDEAEEDAGAPAPIAEPPEEAADPDRVAIPAGVLRAGSAPGTPSRRPSVEADLVAVELPAFTIDRLPYPNEPGAAPLEVESRAEAAARCEARGQRLCHELEWERACKGEGALGLGREWTASDAGDRLARGERTAVSRGGDDDEPLSARRCAARHAVAPEGEALAFRCCGGPAPEIAYPPVAEAPMFRDLELDDARYRAALAGVPELAAYAETFDAYDHADALRALARGGATEADMQWALAPGPFAWSPSPGEEVWVLAGSAGEATVIAAIYPLPDGSFRHAASFVFADEAAPVAILRTRLSRGELLWSACWGCDGESGAIRFDETARVVIAQQ